MHQLQGERSYHIFYQLVRGADKKLRDALRLPAKPEEFKYLAQSGCLVRTGWHVVCTARLCADPV